MKTTTDKNEILAKIEFLKIQKTIELEELKNQYQETVTSFKPLNIIKTISNEIIFLPNLKSNLIKSAIGFGTNYLIEKFLTDNGVHPLKRVLEKLLKIAMKNFIGIKSKKI